jgi:hypothetical protein
VTWATRQTASKVALAAWPRSTNVGAKLLIVTNVSPSLIVLDLPEVTTERLKELMRGDGSRIPALSSNGSCDVPDIIDLAQCHGL